MLRWPITYEDYDGNERTETFMFNLTKAEVMRMELTSEGGLDQYIKKITEARNGKLITEFVEKLIFSAYGEKSLDGRRFIKNDDNGRPLWESFKDTEAYSNLFMTLVTDSEQTAKFIEGILPKVSNPNGSIPVPVEQN